MESANFNSLITLGEPTVDQSDHKFNVKLNSDHPVFEGHFPERAILPGVVMIELVKQATQRIIGKDLKMKESKVIKFLRMIEPSVSNEIDLTLNINEEESEIKVKAGLSSEKDIFFKESVTFVEK